MSYKNFGENIKRLRTQKGINQQQVAKFLGHNTPSRISKWEQGQSYPDYPETYEKIAEFFGVDEIELYLPPNHNFKLQKSIEIPIIPYPGKNLPSLLFSPERKNLPTITYVIGAEGGEKGEDLKSWFCLKLNHDNMEKFEKGDNLICDINAAPKHDDYVVIETEKENDIFLYQLKVYGNQKVLRSLNSSYQDKIITPSVTVTAKVVSKFSIEHF